MSPTGALLGITRVFRWTVGLDRNEAIGAGDDVAPLKIVSIQRLKELAPQLVQVPEGAGGGGHPELVRFNLLNLNDEPVTVRAIGVPNAVRKCCDVTLFPRSSSVVVVFTRSCWKSDLDSARS